MSVVNGGTVVTVVSGGTVVTVVGGKVTGGTWLGGGGTGSVDVVTSDGAVVIVGSSDVGGEVSVGPKASTHHVPEAGSWRPAHVSP